MTNGTGNCFENGERGRKLDCSGRASETHRDYGGRGRKGQKIIRWEDARVEKRISREAGNAWVKEDIKIQDVIELMDRYWIRGQHGTFGKEHLGISKSTFRRRLRYFEDKYGSLEKALEAGCVYFTDRPGTNEE